MNRMRLVCGLVAALVVAACGSSGGGGGGNARNSYARQTVQLPARPSSTRARRAYRAASPRRCNYPTTAPCQYVFRDSLGEETAIPDNIKSYVNDAHPKTGVLLVANDDKFSSDGGKIVQNTVGQYNITLLKTIPFSKAAADLSPF